LSRLRWLILIVGPLPIVGVSCALSAWFRSEPRAVAARNDAIVDASSDSRAAAARKAHDAPRPATDALREECQRAAARLHARAGAGFQVAVHPPFVLGGDLPAAGLEACYADTIAPAVRAMQQRYFRTRPHEPITVLVFRGEESYNRYSRKLFGDSGVSIYGYYKPSVRTLILNLGTGNGTLLHELTHALMDFELPDVPVWLNEGLASLHEQCRFRADDGGPWIEGLVNWRLDGLQTVIRQGRLRSLTELFEERDFRGPLVGTNYAHARYFCMYLQQRGLLERFFRDYCARRASDLTGAAAVARVLGEPSWEEIDRDFARWAMSLSP
jgi:hypothetical protein